MSTTDFIWLELPPIQMGEAIVSGRVSADFRGRYSHRELEPALHALIKKAQELGHGVELRIAIAVSPTK